MLLWGESAPHREGSWGFGFSAYAKDERKEERKWKNIPRISQIILCIFRSRNKSLNYSDFVSDLAARVHFASVVSWTSWKHFVQVTDLNKFSTEISREHSDDSRSRDDKFPQGCRAPNGMGNPRLLRQFITFASISLRNLLVSGETRGAGQARPDDTLMNSWVGKLSRSLLKILYSISKHFLSLLSQLPYRLSLAHDKREKAPVEIKRWSITANREISRKAFLELKMLKVNRFSQPPPNTTRNLNCFRCLAFKS